MFLIWKNITDLKMRSRQKIGYAYGTEEDEDILNE